MALTMRHSSGGLSFLIVYQLSSVMFGGFSSTIYTNSIRFSTNNIFLYFSALLKFSIVEANYVDNMKSSPDLFDMCLKKNIYAGIFIRLIHVDSKREGFHKPYFSKFYKF